jgi:hypothetical protein
VGSVPSLSDTVLRVAFLRRGDCVCFEVFTEVTGFRKNMLPPSSELHHSTKCTFLINSRFDVIVC